MTSYIKEGLYSHHDPVYISNKFAATGWLRADICEWAAQMVCRFFDFAKSAARRAVRVIQVQPLAVSLYLRFNAVYWKPNDVFVCSLLEKVNQRSFVTLKKWYLSHLFYFGLV